jgi:hypothetical protein
MSLFPERQPDRALVPSTQLSSFENPTELNRKVPSLFSPFQETMQLAGKPSGSQHPITFTFFILFFYCLNTHAPLHRSNTTCFIVHFRYSECRDQSVSGFPLQVSLLHRYLLVPIKVISAIVTIDQSLWIWRTVKIIFSASRLFLVYLPAISQTFWHCTWTFLFVYLVSRTDTVNGLTFDLRFHRGSLISLYFCSGWDNAWFSRCLSSSLWGRGLHLSLAFVYLVLWEKLFCCLCFRALFPFLLPV